MLIYLVRHGRPFGVEGICYGRRDVRVRARETDRVARSLRSKVPEEVLRAAPIYSSPLQRCAVLARQIAGGRPVAVTPALLELDFGSWQGRDWSDIPRAELDAWAADLWHYAPGGGESARAAAQRWRAWVGSLLEPSLDAVIAVTHAGLIRIAHAVRSASDPALLSMDVAYGSVHPLPARASAALGTRRSGVAA
jgi:alpha-ribazole phosphatase